jgi:lysophospholipase L1-like esterase
MNVIVANRCHNGICFLFYDEEGVAKMKQILCFGDSNTYGLIPGTADRYDWNTRWTGILDKKFNDSGYRIVEEGLCGRTTDFDDTRRIGRRGTEILPVILESHKPIDTLVLMLGTNDCKSEYGATPERIGAGIERLLEQARKSSPDIKILLISPIELGNRVWEDGYDPEFNANSVKVSKGLSKVYERIADNRNIRFLQASSYAKPSTDDREHLNAEGHKSLADAIYNELREIV